MICYEVFFPCKLLRKRTMTPTGNIYGATRLDWGFQTETGAPRGWWPVLHD